jgi:hypothetical protein
LFDYFFDFRISEWSLWERKTIGGNGASGFETIMGSLSEGILEAQEM